MDVLLKILEIPESASYIWLFLLYFIEGPISNFVSAMIAASGFLNIWYIFVLASVAEVLADIVYFNLGKYGSRGFVEKALKKINDLEFFKLVNKYATKKTFITLFLVKGTPGLAIPSLILIGRGKLTFKEFIINLLPISILRNVILSFLGYSSILSIEAVYNYYGYTKAFSYGAILLVLMVVLFFERHHLKAFFRNVVKKRLSKGPS